MISILGIGVVTALVVLALVLKTRASEPKKAQKAEKAAIMKQLLALSERDSGSYTMLFCRRSATITYKSKMD